jgi:uncharacterized protein (DUF2141 family)
MNKRFVQQFNIGLFLLVGMGSLYGVNQAIAQGETQPAQAQPTETQEIEAQEIETQPTEAQSTTTLTVEVANLRNQEGNVCFKLFSGSDGFPNDDDSALQRTCVAIDSLTESNETAIGSASENTTPLFRYTFENLAVGNYAIAIYHDRNSDERLNRTLFGIPAEGYGFSNDAPANFGPAKFDDAVFALQEPNSTIQIRMRYP